MSESGMFVYISHADSNEVRVLQLHPGTGALAPVETVPVPGKAMSIAVSPDQCSLYVALRTPPYAVASFAIDQLSGRLTTLGCAPLPDSALYLSVDHGGRFLFSTSVPDDKRVRTSFLGVSPIGPNGCAQAPHQVVRAEPKIHSIIPDPSNRYLFAASCLADMILRYRFDEKTGMFSVGDLAPIRVKPRAGPRHLVFHPNNRFMYLVNETDASIYAFALDIGTAALHELQIESALPPGFEGAEPLGSDIRLTPDGRYLYASERASSSLAAFRVDLATGMLSRIASYPTERQPREFEIDPFGRHLLVAGQFSNGVSAYAIHRDSGELTKIGEYQVGKAPNCVKVLRLH